jgi:chloramphenicol-sensitive protein RarD
MVPHPPAPGNRPALVAGIFAYTIWGVMPLYFILAASFGLPETLIVLHRVIWSAPCALILVLLARQHVELLTVLRRPRVLGLLALSAAAIFINWMIYVWAVTGHRTLETSLGYYINPLMNMAVGAWLLREKIRRSGLVAIALATVGVALQTAALGHVPLVSLGLATTFCIYGVIRKQAPVSAQTGLLIETLLLAAPGVAALAWLASTGQEVVPRDLATWGIVMLAGPVTVTPLALFAWAARRLPMVSLGFLQFIAPTLLFAVGVATGEAFTPLRAASFVFIWGGVAVFAFGVWRGSRAQSAARPAN